MSLQLRERVLATGPKGRIVAVEGPGGRTIVLFKRRKKSGVETKPARVNPQGYTSKLLEAFDDALREVLSAGKPVVKASHPEIGIVSWSLPAWITCPGSTRFCLEYCYAQKGQYAMNPNVEKTRIVNLLSMLLPGFVDEAVRVLEREARKAMESGRRKNLSLDEPVIRFFDSGDIPDPVVLKARLKQLGVDVEKLERVLGVRLDQLPRDYFARLIYEMARRLNERGVRVYLYTRTWRVPHIRPWVERLAQLPKTVVWLSVDYTMCDREIEEAERLASRYARMGVAYTGLLPREGRQYHLCPKVLGVVNCAKCKVCPYLRSKRVVLPVH